MLIRDVEVPGRFKELIDAGIASGRFCDARQAVLAGLELLEQQE